MYYAIVIGVRQGRGRTLEPKARENKKVETRHVTLTGLCFQCWFLHPIFKSFLWDQTPDTRHPTRMFHHSCCSSIPIDFNCVQYTYSMYPHTKWYMDARNRNFGPEVSVLHRMCDARTLLHGQPTHSPELPRSVGRDVNDVTSGGRYGWIWLNFWRFIIQR
jgi:hypothetical protein